MKNLLILEEAAQFALCIYFVSFLPFSGWWYAAFFLAPDLGMMGYLVNPKVGAFSYNLFHHKAVAFVLLGLGLYTLKPSLVFAGLVVLGHSAFDRILGYGLKFGDHFQHTHLGWIGKKASPETEKS